MAASIPMSSGTGGGLRFRTVIIVRYEYEMSYGMTLEQKKDGHDFPMVAFVKPGSPAARAGMERGWSIISVAGKSVRGWCVRDVAFCFRNLNKVEIIVDTRKAWQPSVPVKVRALPDYSGASTSGSESSSSAQQAASRAGAGGTVSMAPLPKHLQIFNPRQLPSPSHPPRFQRTSPSMPKMAPLPQQVASLPGSTVNAAFAPVSRGAPFAASTGPAAAVDRSLTSHNADPAQASASNLASASTVTPVSAAGLSPSHPQHRSEGLQKSIAVASLPQTSLPTSAISPASTSTSSTQVGSSSQVSSQTSISSPFPAISSDQVIKNGAIEASSAPLESSSSQKPADVVRDTAVPERMPPAHPPGSLSSKQHIHSAAATDSSNGGAPTVAPLPSSALQTVSMQPDSASAMLAPSLATAAVSGTTLAQEQAVAQQPAQEAIPPLKQSNTKDAVLPSTQQHVSSKTVDGNVNSSIADGCVIRQDVVKQNDLNNTATGTTPAKTSDVPTESVKDPVDRVSVSSSHQIVEANQVQPSNKPGVSTEHIMPSSAFIFPSASHLLVQETKEPYQHPQALDNNLKHHTPTKRKRKRDRCSQNDSNHPSEVAASSDGKNRTKSRRRRHSVSAETSSTDSDHGIEERQQGRRQSARRREGRARQSLTVDRLVTMGFRREDAEASVLACGHDPDACMVWIVSHMEEKQFLRDLNQASIQSELSKQQEAKHMKKQESEILRNATAFTSLFPTSVILSSASTAQSIKHLAGRTIGHVGPQSWMRVLLTDLFTLEAKAMKWYKDACKCYLLQLADRLEQAVQGHEVLQCCAKLSEGSRRAPEFMDEALCVFLKCLEQEKAQLTKVLFDMPENQGGVPIAFLEADEATKFDLEEDGFEVIDCIEADGLD